MIKPSRYNFLFEIDNGMALAFNSASGALAEIDRESYPIIKKVFSQIDFVDMNIDQDLLDNLLDGGYLIEGDIDELMDLEKKGGKERLEKDTLVLTIAPTLACNFSCDYCFESQSTERMTEQTEKALLEFCEEKLKHCKGLLVSWFGGEPTLCMSIIKRLQKEMKELTEKYGVNFYPASIISNGYLLDKRMANRLKNMGITEVQITLDGNEEMHDKRRKLKNGKGSFQRILDNLTESAGILNISIRINIDKSNFEPAYEVIQILKEREILDKVDAHFARVTSSGASACASIRDRCFTDEEFANNTIELYQRLFDIGIYRSEYPQVFSTGYCGAVSEYSYVVSPTGLLFGCWEELSNDTDNSIGSIYDSNPDKRQMSNIDKYKNWNPFKVNECAECDILPVCMGGCPIHGIKSNNFNQGICSPYKYNLKDMLILRYRCREREEVSS